jgi:hypothetical protein
MKAFHSLNSFAASDYTGKYATVIASCLQIVMYSTFTRIKKQYGLHIAMYLLVIINTHDLRVVDT